MDLASLPWLLPPPPDFRQRLNHLVAAGGCVGPELRRLATRRLEDIDQLLKLARELAALRQRPEALAPLQPFRLGVLANATADFIAPAIEGSGLRHGMAIETAVHAYGQIMQAAADPTSVLYARPLDAVLLALDHHAFGLDRAGTADEAFDLIQAIREHVARIAGVPCIVQTLPWAAATLARQPRHDGVEEDSLRKAREVADFNLRIIAALRNSTDVLFDVQGLAESVGLANWHDPVAWCSAKLPFALPLAPFLYADHVARLVAAIVGRTRKCLVLDLDNTLWGGVIGDDGLEGLRLAEGDAVGEAFLAIQRHALGLSQRGVILAVASKNAEATARLPFQHHPDMLLREEHIAVFQANWSDKATNLREIARELNIGTDALVLLDDNPAEREIVRRELPEVGVPELPDDAALYPWVLAAGVLRRRLAERRRPPAQQLLSRRRRAWGAARRVHRYRRLSALAGHDAHRRTVRCGRARAHRPADQQVQPVQSDHPPLHRSGRREDAGRSVAADRSGAALRPVRRQWHDQRRHLPPGRSAVGDRYLADELPRARAAGSSRRC